MACAEKKCYTLKVKLILIVIADDNLFVSFGFKNVLFSFHVPSGITIRNEKKLFH